MSERERMILRALYDSLMMEDLLRKFHRFSRRERETMRKEKDEKTIRTDREIKEGNRT